MRISVEPKDLFMYAVYLAFPSDEPEAEDEQIKEYLAEHKLVPKRQTVQEWDNQPFEVMYFGGCYIGQHLSTIAAMQREAVEREYLTCAIRQAIQDSGDHDLDGLVSQLVEELHVDSSFGTDEEGKLKVVLEPEQIQRRYLQLAGHQ